MMIILKVKPQAKPHLKWLLEHLKDEIEILSPEDLEKMEDAILAEAIKEGDRGDLVSEEEILRALRE